MRDWDTGKSMRCLVIIGLMATVLGCDRNPGPDSISSHTAGGGGGGCSCHAQQAGARRPVLGLSGDFAGNGIVASHHVAGGADPDAAQCLVCHDLSNHTLGTVVLRNADSGALIAFDPAVPSTLEPFCLSCHDGDGALATSAAGSALSPFADGMTLGVMPFGAGTTIAASWNGPSSAHRGNGLSCLGAGTPNTGCHGRNGAVNAHGSVNRGLLTNAMNFQIPLVTYGVYTPDPLGSSFDYNNYRLCLDCHENYPAVTKEVVFGYAAGGVYDSWKAPTPYPTSGMQSLFRERYIADPANYPAAWGGISQPYNDTLFNDANLALHNYHLIGFEVDTFALPFNEVNMLQWRYRGDPAQVGRITCTACHNVHGTASVTVRSTYPQLGLQQDYPFWTGFTPFPGEGYTSIDPFIDAAIMTSFPLNCAVDCHGKQGQSSYWNIPNGE